MRTRTAQGTLMLRGDVKGTAGQEGGTRVHAWLLHCAVRGKQHSAAQRSCASKT